ncbi:MAG TPA: hypothetical protein VKV26_19340 [Dehalococcoidia bacterium]|nr:hypothetical protein [Dehalococcoidia bacterium]
MVEQEDKAWGAYVPAMPGVVAVGSSEAEVIDLIESALSFHFADEHRVQLACEAHDEVDAEVQRLAQEASATLTLAEAAQIAGVTLGAITNAIARGRLTATPAPADAMPVRGRRTRLVYRQEVEQWRKQRAARLTRQLRRLTHR